MRKRLENTSMTIDYDDYDHEERSCRSWTDLTRLPVINWIFFVDDRSRLIDSVQNR